MRECSRKRPTTETTRIVSERPATSGPQRADAAHEELDAHSRLRRAVERAHHFGVGEAVHLDADPGRLARARMARLALDQLEHGGEQLHRRHEGAAREPIRRTRRSRERVEQVGDVAGERLRRGEQAEIRVLPSGARVVVPRADVRVAPQRRALAPHDERDLRVHLETDEAVDDVGAGRLERARPADVVLLVEPRLELDQRRDLLAGARRRRGARPRRPTGRPRGTA